MISLRTRTILTGMLLIALGQTAVAAGTLPATGTWVLTQQRLNSVVDRSSIIADGPAGMKDVTFRETFTSHPQTFAADKPYNSRMMVVRVDCGALTYALVRVDYFLKGKYQGTLNVRPFDVIFQPIVKAGMYSLGPVCTVAVAPNMRLETTPHGEIR